jgi:hypothetical protein
MITYRAVPETRPGLGQWAIQGFDGDMPIKGRLHAGYETEAEAADAIEKLARMEPTP